MRRSADKAPPSPEEIQAEKELRDDIASFSHDPEGYVLYNFPWGVKGTPLEHKQIRSWQRAQLRRIGEKLKAGETSPMEVIQEAISSGHGIGKSTEVAWLIKWALDTFEDAKVVVTANTATQLKTKTWPELAKWHRMSLTEHWFTHNATSLVSNEAGHEQTWRADAIPWNESNPEAFAGLHNEGKRVLLIFDEASAIPQIIWETAEGALTDADTEIIWCVYGNPTRTTGRFRECFGRLQHRWAHQNIDSRDVEGTNKALFEKWLEDLKDFGGEDSDFFRVRVRGVFPRASSLQLINSDLVLQAQKREANFLLDDPLIMAVDIARGGDDNCVVRFRRGMDARSIAPTKIPGVFVKDSMVLVARLCVLIEKERPDAIFVDATGVGGPIGDRLRQLGHNVIDVQFGSESPNPKLANLRTYMWMQVLEALKAGLAIDMDPTLEQDLTNVEYTHDKLDRMILERKDHMKERGLASPDDGDALAMLFAYPVAPKSMGGGASPAPRTPDGEDRTPYWAKRGNDEARRRTRGGMEGDRLPVPRAPRRRAA